MMVKIMSDSKRIKGKVHFYVSILAGADQSVESKYSWESVSKQSDNIYQGVIS